MTYFLLGVLCLLTLINLAVAYTRKNLAPELLWLCHASNLLLVVGLWSRSPLLIETALLCIIPGVPMWLLDAVVKKHIRLESTFAHLTSAAVGLYAYCTFTPVTAWYWAWVWWFFLQILSRLYTPAELNVNSAHRVYDIFQPWFKGFAVYWLLQALVIAATFWTLEKTLAWLLH